MASSRAALCSLLRIMAVLSADESHNSYVATNESVYKITINYALFDLHDSETIYMTTTVGVFGSTDAGHFWNERMAEIKKSTLSLSWRLPLLTATIDHVRVTTYKQ